MDELKTVADIKREHPEIADQLKDGVTAGAWARLTGEHKAEPEGKEARVGRDLGTRSAIANGEPENGLPKIDDIFRDKPTRWIARRVLKGGAKQVIMDDLLAAKIPLKTGKNARAALIQDIPYVVRRLKAKGYIVEKSGQNYMWRNRPEGWHDA